VIFAVPAIAISDAGMSTCKVFESTYRSFVFLNLEQDFAAYPTDIADAIRKLEAHESERLDKRKSCNPLKHQLSLILFGLPPRPGWRNWQTQRTQNPPSFGFWGFDSPSRHHRI
jgi:hypothetical protein